MNTLLYLVLVITFNTDGTTGYVVVNADTPMTLEQCVAEVAANEPYVDKAVAANPGVMHAVQRCAAVNEVKI